MKKIKFKYISKNNVSRKIKLMCLVTSLSTVSSCGVTYNKTNDTNSLNNSNTYIESSISQDISINEETCIITEESNFEDETSIENSDTETDTSNIIEEEIVNIDIKSIELSEKEVSMYNTDYMISGELNDKINSYIKGYGASSSFIAINLNDGMTFGYNIDEKYSTASTIKVAFALYCFKEMDKGNGSLDELKLYEERFRRDGSGVLKNKKSGVEYSLRDLFYYTINYSDNVAYYMIHDRFYSEGYNDFLNSLGCKELYLKNGAKWGYIDARSMALIWQELYKYKDESENGKHLFDLLTNAEYNYIREGMENYESAHKSGWTPRETHDSGIVFASDDYIVVTLNNSGGSYKAKSQLLKICSCIEDVIDEYTLYKKENKNKQKTLTK